MVTLIPLFIRYRKNVGLCGRPEMVTLRVFRKESRVGGNKSRHKQENSSLNICICVLFKTREFYYIINVVFTVHGAEVDVNETKGGNLLKGENG